MEKMIVDGVYLHIDNGGASFKVTDNLGLTLEVEVGHFTHVTNAMQLRVDHDTLRHLGQMLIAAADRNDVEPSYDFAAECYGIDKETEKTKRLDGQEPVMVQGTRELPPQG